MHLILGNRRPGICYRSESIAFSPSHRHTDIRCSSWEHGAVVLSPMTLAAPQPISGTRWKTTSVGCFPKSYLPSQIGPQRGEFLGHSAVCSLSRQMSDKKTNKIDPNQPLLRT